MDFFSATRHHREVTDDPKFPSDLADRFQLRMPPGLRERLGEAAKISGRSMNSEAIAALEFWLSDRAQAATREPMSDDEVSILGEALGKAIASSPKLLERFGVIDALVASGQLALIATEDGRQIGPDDLLSSIGETANAEASWPQRIDGGPVSPKEQAMRDSAMKVNERLARKRAERA